MTLANCKPYTTDTRQIPAVKSASLLWEIFFACMWRMQWLRACIYSCCVDSKTPTPEQWSWTDYIFYQDLAVSWRHTLCTKWPSSLPAYIWTYSGQGSNCHLYFLSFYPGTANKQLPTMNQFWDWTVLYFCILTSLFLLWQLSCPMFNRSCAPSWGGGEFSWSYTIMTTDKSITPTMDGVDCCTLPPNSFWFYSWTRLEYRESLVVPGSSSSHFHSRSVSHSLLFQLPQNDCPEDFSWKESYCSGWILTIKNTL